MKRLLIDEPMLLQQVHYWLQQSKHEHDCRPWIYNTYDEWQRQFPFWSLKTVRNVIGSLEKQGLLVSGHHGATPTDRTKWYTIDYDRLGQIELSTPGRSMWQNLPDASGKKGQLHAASSATSSYTETTTEITDREQQQDAELLLFKAEIIQALEDEGVAPKTARELAEADPDLATDWLEAKREWRNARDPAGLLVAKIRAGEQPPRPRKLRWNR